MMKYFLLFLLLGILTTHLFSQDVIVKTDGTEIPARVVEISQNQIKYLNYDFQDGPVRVIQVSEVFMIVYENGMREFFNVSGSRTDQAETRTDQLDRPVRIESHEYSQYDGNHFLMGVGYGNSYGGYGTRLQLRWGGNVGFGAHAGVGYFPEAPVLASAGMKFFPYRGIYLNLQFGLVGYEYSYEFNWWNGDFYFEEYSGLLYGPSLMTGIDIFWGRNIGFGFNAGAGVTYLMNKRSGVGSDLTLALDLGFIVKF